MKKVQTYDVVIIGAGLAGVFCALSLSSSLKIALISNGSIETSNSYLAQGGVAAPVGLGDSIENHIEDTLKCGHGFGDPKAVSQLIGSAADAIDRLEGYGVKFDRNEDGSYFLGREGAHCCARILRVGDFTGRAIMEVLWERLKERDNVTRLTQCEVLQLHIRDGYRKAIWVKEDVLHVIESDVLVIATGGLGRLYGRTSNNMGIDGAGIALAIGAGLETRHLELVQFHPTVFQNLSGPQEGFLISEAVRGEGGILRNEANERFMLKVHEMGELAPRDVVSSAILNEIEHQAQPYVWLDVRHIGSQRMAKHFPTIYAYATRQGLNLDVDMMPVAPGAHYLMGGIATDLNGETGVTGVFAIGECAFTGVHGKNRLASNSLLEAMVFAMKAADSINERSPAALMPNEVATPVLVRDYEEEVFDLTSWMDLNMGICKNRRAILAKLHELESMTYRLIDISDASLEMVKRSNQIVLLREMLRQTIGEWEC